MLGKVIKPILDVPASLACFASRPNLLEVSLEVILVVSHPTLPLEAGRHTRVDVVEGECALDVAFLGEIILKSSLSVLLIQ